MTLHHNNAKHLSRKWDSSISVQYSAVWLEVCVHIVWAVQDGISIFYWIPCYWGQRTSLVNVSFVVMNLCCTSACVCVCVCVCVCLLRTCEGDVCVRILRPLHVESIREGTCWPWDSRRTMSECLLYAKQSGGVWLPCVCVCVCVWVCSYMNLAVHNQQGAGRAEEWGIDKEKAWCVCVCVWRCIYKACRTNTHTQTLPGPICFVLIQFALFLLRVSICNIMCNLDRLWVM